MASPPRVAMIREPSLSMRRGLISLEPIDDAGQVSATFVVDSE
jgi:hypothetical protein